VSAVLVLATVVPGLAQATDKTFWTNFTLVNLGDGPAAGTVEYVTTAGGEWGSESFTIDEPGGQAIFRQYADAGDPGNPDLDDGNGSVVVSADQPLGAVVQILARGQDPTSSGAYSGFEAGDASFYVPLAAKELATASGTANSQIIVQNTGGDAADVEIELIASDGTSTYTADGGSLAPGASWYYDLAEESDSNVPDSWYGSAVASTDTAGASIVVVSNFFTGDAMQTFNAFGASAPGTAWAVPLFTSRLANSLSTPIAVQNLSDPPTTIPVGGVTVTCQPDPSLGGAPHVMSNALPIGHSASYFFNPVTDMTIPEGFYGACLVQTTGADVVAFVQMRFVDTGEAAAYEAMAAGSTKVSVPLVAKRLGNGFATAVTVQNLSVTSAATVDITYIPSPDYGGSATPLEIDDVTIPLGGSLIHNHRITSGSGAVTSMPDGWFGTMVVESESQPINAFVQLTFMSSINPGLPGGDNFMAHNAFTGD
jgi:hypothetical protein